MSTWQIQRRREIVNKPSCIDEYNQYMNGCDREHQQIQYYGLQKRKSKKIFHLWIEMSVINASIIYNKTRERESKKKIPLADLKKFTNETAYTWSCYRKAKKGIPIPVPVVQRLAPEIHFMVTVKDDRNCLVYSKPRQRKSLPWEALSL